MATVRNACGIDYWNGLGMNSTDQLDVDALAIQTGRGRLSIQKALKRVRKLSAAISNIKVFSQKQEGRVAYGRCAYAATAASQVVAYGLTPTTAQGGERGGRGGSSSSSHTDMTVASDNTNDSLRSVHLQQQWTVIDGATGRRYGFRCPHLGHGQHAAAYGHEFEHGQGLSLKQTQSALRLEMNVVNTQLQHQRQE